jgi:hypothetical protein
LLGTHKEETIRRVERVQVEEADGCQLLGKNGGRKTQLNEKRAKERKRSGFSLLLSLP